MPRIPPEAHPELRLVALETPAQVEETRAILREYAQSLSVDLRFQNFEYELDTLPGDYAMPRGRMLLAYIGDTLAGCGAFRATPESDYANACEMKRLYVRPAFRRFGLGRVIAQALLDEARSSGYSTMLLDTLDDMEAARGLYVTLGFEEIPPYYFNPIAGAHYLKADLD